MTFLNTLLSTVLIAFTNPFLKAFIVIAILIVIGSTINERMKKPENKKRVLWNEPTGDGIHEGI